MRGIHDNTVNFRGWVTCLDCKKQWDESAPSPLSCKEEERTFTLSDLRLLRERIEAKEESIETYMGDVFTVVLLSDIKEIFSQLMGEEE